jgi:hypothetical protein
MKEKRKSLILLLLLTIGSLSTAFADITKTGNPALWKLITKSYPTLVQDEALTSEELAMITELNSKGAGIASVTNLDGIDQLTNLKKLVLSGCINLTTMPAFPTSLTSLTWTECAVPSLDLSSYTNLQELNMQGSTANTTVISITLPASDSQLKILNVFNHKSLATINNLGACGNLEELDLGLTQYPGNGSDGTLDLSVFPDIKVLSIDRDTKIKKLIITDKEMSDLTYLKLDGHPELTKEADFKDHLKKCTNLETLSLRNCGFTDNTLDVTGHAALKKLYVSNCGLKSLNLSDVHVQLEMLDCASNSLPELYIPSSVTSLTISANSFDSVDDLKNFSNATNLTKLTCNSNSSMVGTFDFTNYEHLQQIEFTSCKKLTKISGLSSSQSTLKTLKCNHCDLDPNSLDVSALSNLTLLNCTDNPRLASINVTSCTKLKTLGCGDCNISVLDISGMENLKTLYCPNNKIEELKLNSNSLTFINCENNALTSLDLSKDAGQLQSSYDNWYSSTTGQKISKAVGVIEGNRLYVKIPSPSLAWDDISVKRDSFLVNDSVYKFSEVQTIAGEEGYSYLVFTDAITKSKPYFTLNDDGTSSDINITYTYHPCGSATVNSKLTDTELYKNRTNTVNMSVTISINAFAQKISPYATDSENEGKYFSTLYLPDNRNIVSNMDLSKCEFYTITDATDIDNNHTKSLTLEEQNLSLIPTKTPLLVVAPESNVMVYNKVTDDATALSGTNFLKGTFSSDFSGAIYTLGRNKSVNYHGLIGFWKYTGSSLSPYSCYIESFGDSSTAKGFLLSLKDETTGINNIENAGNVDESNDTWYTVNGIRLNGKPNAKGIYIRNNKKVIIAE